MASRPKTAPNNRLRSDENGTVTRHDNPLLFSGGKLRLTVLNAEKYIGQSKLVFGGAGVHPSKIQVYSLNEMLGESIVNHGGVDEDFQWAGYEDDLKEMDITNSPIVRIVVFACDRSNCRQPLGWATVSLMDMPDIGSDDYRTTTAVQTRGDVDSFDPKAVSIVGSITLKLQYDPFKVVSLGQFEDHHIDTKDMTAIRFGFGWSSAEAATDVSSGAYSASLVMFDRNGRFIDAVDSRHPRSKRGPRCLHRRIPDKSGDGFADIEAVQLQLASAAPQRLSNVFAVFVVITAADPGASLSDLSGGMYFRVVHGNSNKENCRYSVLVRPIHRVTTYHLHNCMRMCNLQIDEPSSACIMARLVRDPALPYNWTVKAFGQLTFTERHFGALLPEMRDLLGDVVPNCKGSGKDIISYCLVEKWLELAPLLAADLTTQPMLSAATGDNPEATDESIAPPVPKDVTNISIGINWEHLTEKSVEVDVGCLFIDSEKAVVDSISGDKPRSNCGSVGFATVDLEEEGLDVAALDNKVLFISLAEVPESIVTVAFYILNSNVGENLRSIGSVNAHVFETESRREVALLDCSGTVSLSEYPTLLLCVLTRHAGTWLFMNTSRPSAVPDLLENGVLLDEYLSSGRLLGS